jgi:hypothetical protein
MDAGLVVFSFSAVSPSMRTPGHAPHPPPHKRGQAPLGRPPLSDTHYDAGAIFMRRRPLDKYEARR